MKTNPASPIRTHIRELLVSNPKTVAKWARLISGAATRSGDLTLNAYRPPRTAFFVRFGALASGRQNFPIRVRFRGWDVGMIRSGFGTQPMFVRSQPTKRDSELRRAFVSLEKTLGETDWTILRNGCAWTSKVTRAFFKGLRDLSLPDEYSELEIEEALIKSLRPPKAFWFDNCSLVQRIGRASIPFKFTAPIVIDQTENGDWDEPSARLALIKPTNHYGYPDLLARCEGAIGGKSQRLGVLEIKKPGGYGGVSLLQAYAYAVAFDEVQCLWSQDTADSLQNLRKLLGYPNPSPKQIRFAAYAIVAEDEVADVRENKLTDSVLREAGDAVLVGVLGYELARGAVRLTSAVQWVDRQWKSFLDAAPVDRRIVSLVR